MGDNVNRRQLSQAASRVGFSELPIQGETLGNVSFGSGGVRADLTPQQRQQFNEFGGQFNQANDTTTALNPQVASTGAQNLEAGQAELRAAVSTDPLDQAETRFNRLRGILDKGRNRQRDSAESRLLAQGRLGGEGGARRLEGLEEGFSNTDARLLDSIQGQEQGFRSQRIADALGVQEQGLDVSNNQFNRLGSTVQTQSGMNADLLKVLGLQSDLGSARTGGQLSAVEAIKSANSSNFATDNGPSFMQSLVQQGITGAATAFGGPLAGFASSKLTAALPTT